MAIKDLIQSLKKKKGEFDTNVSNTFRDLKWQAGVNQNEYNDKSVGFKIVEPFAKAQEWLQSPTTRVKLGNDQQYNQGDNWATTAGKTAFNFAKGATEGVLTEPIKVISDVGQGIGSLVTQNPSYRQASFSSRLGQDLASYPMAKVNPFQGIGKPVAGKWNVGNFNIPDFGVSESPIANTAGLAVGAFEPVYTAMGAKNPKAILGYLGASGLIGGGANAVMGGNFGEGAKQAMISIAPKAPAMAGFAGATNKLTTLGNLPIRTGANILQGIGIDRAIGAETTPTSIAIDAVFPGASEVVGKVTGKVFKSAGEALRSVQAEFLTSFGKKLRNNKGLYTTRDKFKKGTRAYIRSDKSKMASAGFMAGVEPYQDTQGNWKVRFNADKALLGMGIGLGVKSGVKNIDDALRGVNPKAQLDPLEILRKEASDWQSAKGFVNRMRSRQWDKNTIEAFKNKYNPQSNEDVEKSLLKIWKEAPRPTKAEREASKAKTTVENIMDMARRKGMEMDASLSKTDPLASLKEEARKYKSAEEFVNKIAEDFYILNKAPKRMGGMYLADKKNLLYRIKNRLLENLGEDTGIYHKFKGGGFGKLYKFGNETFHSLIGRDQYLVQTDKRLNAIAKELIDELNKSSELRNKYSDYLKNGRFRLDDIGFDYSTPYSEHPTFHFSIDGVSQEIYGVNKKYNDELKSIYKQLPSKSEIKLEELDVPQDSIKGELTDEIENRLKFISENIKTKSQLTDIWNKAKGEGRIDRTKLTGMQLDTPNTKLQKAYGNVSNPSVSQVSKELGGITEAMSQKQNPELNQPKIKLKTSSETPLNRVSGDLSLNRDDNIPTQGNFDRTYAEFIANRDVGKTIATQRASQYAKIPQKIAKDVIDYMENIKDNVSTEAKSFGDAMKAEYRALFKQASEVADRAGMPIGEVKNYVPHFWKEGEEEVMQMFMSAKKNFPNAKERVLPTYEEGIKMGLTPRFTHPAQIMEQYVRNLEKFKANIQFVEQLKKAKLLVPQSAYVPRNYVEVRAEGIPKDLYAPPEVAREINRLFNPEYQSGFAKAVEKVANFSSGLQDITLSGGVPATPINAFSLAQIQKELISGNFKSPFSAMANSLSTKRTAEFFSKNAEQIKKMQSRNVPVYSDYSVENMIDKGLAKRLFGDGVGNAWSKIINEPTFKRFMPMLQINLFNEIEKGVLKSGKTPEQATEIASKVVKNFYGLVPTDEAAKRSSFTNDVLTATFFAPHYRESMIRMWINTVKSIKNPLAMENSANVRFAVGAIATYAIMSALNKAYSGNFMHENPEGKKDKLLIPLGDGYTLGIPFLSSIATMPRMAVNMAGQVLQGDLAGVASEGRKSLSMAIKPIADAISNMDYFEREIVSETDTPQERLTKQATYLFKSYVGHPYVRELIDMYVNPEKPLYQRLSNAMEAPLRFYKTESIETAPFWDKYNQLKAVNERYKALAREDKDKATDYLNEYESDINEFNLMSAYLDYYYQQKEGGETPTALKEYLATTKQESKYENSPDAPQDLIGKTGLYFKSAVTNPIDTFNAVTSGQPIRKMRGDATVLEREIAKTDRDPNTQKDHRIPLWAGGDNSDKNTYYISTEVHKAKTEYENGLRKKLEAGTMNKEQVQQAIKQWHVDNNVKSLMPPTPKIKIAGATNKTTIKNGFTYVDAKGKEQTIDLDFEPTAPKLTGDTELDKKLKSKYASEVTKKRNDIIALYEQNQLTAEEAEKQLLALKKQQTKSTGGAKKVTINFKAPTMDAGIKTAKYTPLKIKTSQKPSLAPKTAISGGKLKIRAKPNIKALKSKLKVRV